MRTPCLSCMYPSMDRSACEGGFHKAAFIVERFAARLCVHVYQSLHFAFRRQAASGDSESVLPMETQGLVRRTGARTVRKRPQLAHWLCRVLGGRLSSWCPCRMSCVPFASFMDSTKTVSFSAKTAVWHCDHVCVYRVFPRCRRARVLLRFGQVS